MANEANLIQNLLDSSDVVVYLKDDQGRFLMVNRTFEKLFKLPKEQIIGKTDYDFGSKEQADKFRANDLKATEAGAPITFKESVFPPDGPRTYISHKFPVSNIEGSPNAVGGISIDITEIE